MPLTLTNGDPLTTDAQWLAIGHNARGRTELGMFETAAAHHYPAAFAMYQRRARTRKQTVGTFWQWRESQPYLLFLTVRPSSVSATRLRYVQHIFLTIARDYRRYGMQSLAIAPLGNAYERHEIISLAQTWLAPAALPITLYETYLPTDAHDVELS